MSLGMREKGRLALTATGRDDTVEVMKTRVVLVFLAVIAVAASVIGYFIFLAPEKRSIHPVVFIGLDGADWNIIDVLFEQGKLPHLSALVEEGSRGVLETVEPVNSPVIWTSIATGKTMLKHGILDHRFINDRKIEVPFSARELRAKTLWNIFSEEGFTTGIINWWVTFPAQKVNGFMVSDRFRLGAFSRRAPKGLTFPEALKEKILPQFARSSQETYEQILREEGLRDYRTIGEKLGDKIPPIYRKRIDTFMANSLGDKTIEKVTLSLLEDIPEDFFATYFRLIDTTSHFCDVFLDQDLKERWFLDVDRHGGPTPETEKQLYQGMASIIEPVYIYLDNVVGRIVAKSPQHTMFILASDHGFNFSRKIYGHINMPVIPHGIIIIKGPGVRPGYRLENAHIFDVTPTLLYHYNLPVARDMDGEVLLDAFLDSYRNTRKLRYIATYGAYPKRKKAKEPQPLDDKVLEDLRSLGYIR